MNTKYAINTLLVSTVFAITMQSSVYASPSHDDTSGKHCQQHGKMHQKSDKNHRSDYQGMPRSFKDLNLSATQKEQISALIAQQKPQLETDWKQRRSLMKEMHTLTNAETLDEKQAESIATQMASLEKETVLNRVKTGNKIYAVLSPEQRKQMTENMKKRMDKAEAEPASFQSYGQKLIDWVKS